MSAMDRRSFLLGAAALPLVPDDGLSPVALPHGEYQPLDPRFTPLPPLRNGTFVMHGVRADLADKPLTYAFNLFD